MPADETSADKLAGEIEALGQRLRQVRQSIGRVIFRSTHDHRSDSYHAAGRRSRAAHRRARPGQDAAGRDARHRRRPRRQTRPVHARPDAGRYRGIRGAGESDTGRRSFRFNSGSRFLPAADGRRDQSRQPTHAVGPAAGHAGAPCLRRRPVSSAARALPRPGDPEPARAGGTYPLPEAQLDRFLMEVDVPYPDLEAERQMLIVTTGPQEDKAVAVMSAEELLAAQRLVRRVPVGESVVNAILTLVRSGRAESSDIDEVRRHVAWGPGPRAARRSCWPAAHAPCLTAASRRPSTTFSRLPVPCCATAWR